jgi:hypothetical protein
MCEVKTSPQVGLGLTKEDNETWRECAIRYGKAYGMDREVAESYDAEIASSEDESTAAWSACRDWDVLNIFVNGTERKAR